MWHLRSDVLSDDLSPASTGLGQPNLSQHQPPPTGPNRPYQSHNRLSAALKDDLSSLGPDLADWGAVARSRALAALVHGADISNAAKGPALSVEWARRVTEGELNGGVRRGLMLGADIASCEAPTTTSTTKPSLNPTDQPQPPA
jgi:hypothetical protein